MKPKPKEHIMSNTSKLQKKIDNSNQFAQVASFIKEISEDGVLNTSFKYLAICPWTDAPLDSRVKNINTTLFCQLFSMKPACCGRHLRTYKELTVES